MNRLNLLDMNLKMHNTESSGFIITFILFFLISVNASAQAPLATKHQLGLFKNSTTCVVLDNSDAAYNVLVRDAVEKHWNITEFEFIDYDEFEKRREQIKYSFIVLVKGVYDKDPGGVSYDFLSLLMGGGLGEISSMSELASIPVAYNENSSETYGYAIPQIVQFMQKQVRVMEDHRLMISLFGLKYYNFFRNFRDKALLIPEHALAPEINSLYKVKDAYPFYVEVISQTQLEDRISEQPKNTLFLLHVGPEGEERSGKCFEMVFSTDGELYYYRARDITNEDPDGLTGRDLKKMR